MYSSWIFTILLLPQCFYLTGGISMETIDFKIFRAQMQLQDRMESLRKELKTEISFLRDHVIALLGKGIAKTMPPPDIEKKIGDEQKEFRDNIVDREQFVELANKCELVTEAFGKQKEINVKLRHELSVLKEELNKEMINRRSDFDRNVTVMTDRFFNIMEVWKANTTKAIRNDMKSSENRTAASFLDRLEVWKANTTTVIRNDMETSENRTAVLLLDMLEVWKAKTTTKIMNIMNTVENRTKALSIKVDESVQMIQEEQTAKFDNITVMIRRMAVASPTTEIVETTSKFQEDMQTDMNQKTVIPLTSTIVPVTRTQPFDNDLSPDIAYVIDKEYVLCNRRYLDSDSQEVRIGDLKDFIVVVCDQKTDGGGWAIIYNWDWEGKWTNKTWKDYQKGYDEGWSETWIGFVYLQPLTAAKSRELRIEMRDVHGTEYSTTFKDFKIIKESDSVITFFGEFNGTLWNDNCFKNTKLSRDLVINSSDIRIWLPLTTCYINTPDSYYYEHYVYYQEDKDEIELITKIQMKIR